VPTEILLLSWVYVSSEKIISVESGKYNDSLLNFLTRGKNYPEIDMDYKLPATI
jgi:hypothetical protein